MQSWGAGQSWLGKALVVLKLSWAGGSTSSPALGAAQSLECLPIYLSSYEYLRYLRGHRSLHFSLLLFLVMVMHSCYSCHVEPTRLLHPYLLLSIGHQSTAFVFIFYISFLFSFFSPSCLLLLVHECRKYLRRPPLKHSEQPLKHFTDHVHTPWRIPRQHLGVYLSATKTSQSFSAVSGAGARMTNGLSEL